MNPADAAARALAALESRVRLPVQVCRLPGLPPLRHTVDYDYGNRVGYCRMLGIRIVALNRKDLIAKFRAACARVAESNPELFKAAVAGFAGDGIEISEPKGLRRASRAAVRVEVEAFAAKNGKTKTALLFEERNLTGKEIAIALGIPYSRMARARWLGGILGRFTTVKAFRKWAGKHCPDILLPDQWAAKRRKAHQLQYQNSQPPKRSSQPNAD